MRVFFRLKANVAVAGDEAGEHERGADGLADDGCDGHARNAEPEPGDERHVEDDVDQTADGQIIQRTLGIADRAEDGCAVVIDEAGRQADGVDVQVELRAADHVRRAAHHFEQRTGEDKQQHAQRRAGEHRQRHGGMHRAVHAVPVAGAGRTGDGHGRADAQPHQQADQQMDEGGRRADGSHRDGIGEAPDDDDIRGII